MVTSIDSSLLLSYYSSRIGSSGGSSAGASSSVSKQVAPTAPWANEGLNPDRSAAVSAVMAGRKFINENTAQLDLPGASADYRKLFALYSGLGTLSGIVEQIQKKGVTSIEKQRLQETFAKGMAELTSYLKTVKLDQARLTMGEVNATAKTTAPVSAKNKTEYVTAPLYAGASSDAVPQFQGAVQFTINVTRSGVLHAVDVNLADMGAQTRSMANVVNFINSKLQAEGVDTRFATQRLPGQERTTTAGGKTISLGAGPDQWALKVKTGGETVNFSAAGTAGSVYLAQGVGNPNPDGKADTKDGVISQQLLKFQTDTTSVEAPIQGLNEANWVDGRVFAKTMGPEIGAVHATQVGPDGSVYVLADVTNSTAGQDIKGDQDVALLKYDSAGKLIYTRTLGASDSATGLALAVSADGKIAVAGSVSGGLNGATNGALNSGDSGAYAGEADSFVTVFNADGEEQWTQRRGARLADEASQITFGADGTVYVAGRSKSALPGTSNLGGWDNYVEAFAPPDAAGKVQTLFAQNFGTAGSDRPAGMVLDGTSLVVASVEDGRGVLRRFDISSGTPVLSATRDLGDLQGGDIAGLALDGSDIIVAGSTSNGALSAGTVTRALSGGVDAFAARLSADLSGSGDSIAYYGGAGDDRATAVSVAGGKVWIAGSAGTDLPGQPAVGKQDGFLANLNVATGAIDWSRRFTGKEGYTAPTAIAATTSGSTSLDRLGLPSGDLDLSDSQKITAVTSIRPGDQFTVRAGSGVSKTVTIDANDTLDTLAQKIRRAAGFQAKVTIGTSDGVRKLTVAPLNNRMVLEFGAGKTDKDALEFLGIPEGVVRNSTVKGTATVPADGKSQIYGLKLDSSLNLDDTLGINHAAAELAAAAGVIRTIYKDLKAAADPLAAQKEAAAAAANGKVPAYLTNQIANYQAALNRLTGGG